LVGNVPWRYGWHFLVFILIRAGCCYRDAMASLDLVLHSGDQRIAKYVSLGCLTSVDDRSLSHILYIYSFQPALNNRRHDHMYHDHRGSQSRIVSVNISLTRISLHKETQMPSRGVSI